MINLTKDQINALSSVLYEDIVNKVEANNKKYVEKIMEDETFNNAYNEFELALKEAKALASKADKTRKEALRSIRVKLQSLNVNIYDSKKSIAYYYGKALGKISEITKKDLRDRITLCTIESRDLETLKQNIIKSFNV